MDSMTLYRGMDIGTAKPSAEDRQRVRHHLLDVLDPWQSASVAWWLAAGGRSAVARSSAREARPVRRRHVVVSQARLPRLFDGPPANDAIRDRLTEEANPRRRQALHERLAAVDPVAAARLHPNDVRRVIRGLWRCGN